MANRVRIKMGSIEFEAEGDSDLIQREREQFFSLLPQVISAVSPVVVERSQIIEAESNTVELNDTRILSMESPVSNTSYESVVSLLNQKSFANDTDLVMGVAYYIDCINKNGPFTAKDIEAKLTEARRTKPSNTSHCINLNIRKGFITECSVKKDGVKAYNVLSDGIKWCELYIAPETKAKKKTIKSKQQKPSESSLVAIPLDELHLDHYCDVPSLEKIADQILVVMLIYTKEKNVEYFSFDDIVSVLKNKFKISVKPRQVRYFFDKSGTKFDKKTEKNLAYHKLMTSGIKEAEEICARQKSD